MRAGRMSTTTSGRCIVSGRIRDEDLQLVRSRSPIVRSWVSISSCAARAAARSRGVPVPRGKDPSFNVTPARGLWYCFSCAEGGDVIAFVRKIDTSASPRRSSASRPGRGRSSCAMSRAARYPGQEQSERRRLNRGAPGRCRADFYVRETRTGTLRQPWRGNSCLRGDSTLADAERFGRGGERAR